MGQIQADGLVQRKPLNRGMFVWLLIDGCADPGGDEIQMQLRYPMGFRKRLRERFHVGPLRWRNAQFLPQLTD